MQIKEISTIWQGTKVESQTSVLPYNSKVPAQWYCNTLFWHAAATLVTESVADSSCHCLSHEVNSHAADDGGSGGGGSDVAALVCHSEMGEEVTMVACGSEAILWDQAIFSQVKKK